MSSWNAKKWVWGLLAFAIFSFTSLTAAVPHAAAQLQSTPTATLCNLPHTSGGASDGTRDWAVISIINRTTFQVTFRPDGVQCTNNSSINIANINGNYGLAQYVNGTYVDSNTRDNTWQYSGADSTAPSRIEQFTNFGVMGRDDDPHVNTLSNADLQKFLGKTELKIRVNEAKIGDVCKGEGGALSVRDFDVFYDVVKNAWQCRDKNDYGMTGFRVMATLDRSTIENYNITFSYSGTDIIPVESRNNGAWHFAPCTGVKGTRGTLYGTKSCTSDARFIELTAADTKALNGTGTLEVSVFGSVANADANSSPTHKITIGGAGNTSTTTATTNTNDSGDNVADCESGGGLGWILCPVITGLAGAADGIYSKFIQPLLYSKPLTLSSTDPRFIAWSNFRVLGDIFLIIALLVIVFGQSIGGGLVDAYTAKKVLPRLLIAGILINISYYLMALAIDITNILGDGIASLLEQPFKGAHAFTLQLNNDVAGNTIGGLGLAAIAGGAIYAFFAAGALINFVLVFMLFPMFLTLLAILATVMIRQGLIILLVLVSPIAFALYCLPNTEQYFRKWWDLLLKTLLVYPIIAVLFALGNIMAATVTLGSDGAGAASEAAADLVAIVALFIPLFLIPFSFKLAGGMLGRLHDTMNGFGKRAHEAYKGNVNDPFSRQNRARYKLNDQNTQLRERAVNSGQAKGAGIGRRAFGRAANWGNLQARRSMYNKQRSEMLQGQSNTGDDSNQRDLFIAWDAAANGGEGAWYRRMDMQKGADGQLHGVAGASAVYSGKNARAIGQTAKNKALRLYGGDQSAVQEALYYEWKKTSFNPDQMNNLASQFGEVKKEHGFNDGEIGGMMKGVTFRHQGQSLAGKHSSFKETKDADGNGTGEWGWSTDHMALTKEGSLNIGTYGWSNQDKKTFQELGKGYEGMTDVVSAYQGESDDFIIPPITAENNQARHTESEYSGKTLGQVKAARANVMDMARTLNPDQGRPGRVDAVGPDGTPQVSGLGGVSSAPVEVQRAAREFYEKVYGPGTPPTPPTPPSPPDLPLPHGDI